MRAANVPFLIPTAAYRRALRRAVDIALREDLGTGDRTTQALGLKGKPGRAILLAKDDGVLAGADAFAACFRRLDRRCRITWKIREGHRFRSRTAVAIVRGNAAALLSAERCALNFVAHLSGIATESAAMAARLPKQGARLLDTRKTTPGLRLLEKRATLLGGAVNHRLGLHDALMLKDNHILAAGGLAAAITAAQRHRGRRRLICEIQSPAQIELALRLGVDWLLLDNFTVAQLRQATRAIRQWQRRHGQAITIEASGGVTARNIAAIARTGVDFVSSGHITHSARSINFSLEWDGTPQRGVRRAAR
ncbi:MAG TPA: carboxylating nicotinate-nucleotide diphosphorylase [bacterium]|nr:carboxylating nicotinate-nucleotide diphosphorylase [bacterium]